MSVSYYSLHLSAETPCLKCVCMYCHNTECPHIREQEKHCKDWITSRCQFCERSWGTNKKPLDFCDFFIPMQKPRPKFYTIIRRYRQKTSHDIILEKLEHLERLLEKEKEL